MDINDVLYCYSQIMLFLGWIEEISQQMHRLEHFISMASKTKNLNIFPQYLRVNCNSKTVIKITFSLFDCKTKKHNNYPFKL